MELTLKEVKLRLKHHLENRTYRDYINSQQTMLNYREEFFKIYPKLAEIDKTLSVKWFVRPTYGEGWVVCHGVAVTDKNSELPLDGFGVLL